MFSGSETSISSSDDNFSSNKETSDGYHFIETETQKPNLFHNNDTDSEMEVVEYDNTKKNNYKHTKKRKLEADIENDSNSDTISVLQSPLCTPNKKRKLNNGNSITSKKKIKI